MTTFEQERLDRYIQDANQWLLVIADMLRLPETSNQAAAASMARAAIELVSGIKQQMNLDKGE
ncbi:hypothetical protein [Sporomusa sphaeroides]|uniref:Uncharacterized protein n=1 Tax=Sporomusa sphaeroides DSM 2875 TaxID=1337886 RepID=A0ABP2C455_9FIRM|nr:hypothetical protein [Sporomusa sphaeroides]OLS56168.1 hypothetical protein SPSPH_25570 [Sporomusa sphaeroides DSM 2875]CVK19190.1 hypothetical protein SSPH_01839 [Sporomusa sphaeroides DSM 2875]